MKVMNMVDIPGILSLASLFSPERKNSTGLSDTLKAGVEHLSGLSMDDISVHYHSSKPAQVQALAYTQGIDIHVRSVNQGLALKCPQPRRPLHRK